MRELSNDTYWSYDELVDSFGVKVVFSEHDNDYQGDSYYLLENGDQYGILIFGWGSCSGCDALEACYGNRAGATELRNDLWSSVNWMDKDELPEYVNSKDWDKEFYFYSDGGPRFINKLKEFV